MIKRNIQHIKQYNNIWQNKTQRSTSQLFFCSQSEIQNNKSTFKEGLFIRNYLGFFKNYNTQYDQQIQQAIKQLEDNASELKKPQSIVAILDNAFKFNVFIPPNILDALIKQANFIFRNHYQPDQDKGDLLRAISLVFGLNKVNAPEFFKQIIEIFILNQDQISLKNKVIMIETLVYNKVIFQVKGLNPQEFCELFRCINDLSPNDIDYFSKFVNLMVFCTKNANNFDLLKEQEVLNKVSRYIQHIYNQTLHIFTTKTPQNFDVFQISDLSNELEMYQRSVIENSKKYRMKSDKAQDLIYVHKNFAQNFNVFINNSLQGRDTYKPQSVIKFVRKYMSAPPVRLHPNLVKIINHSYEIYTFENCEELVPFLYFLTKMFPEKFKISFEKHEFLENNLDKLENVFLLCKMLEICATLKTQTKEQQESLVDIIENKIVSKSQRMANPTMPLILMFQSLASLDKGSLDTWKYLIEYFVYPGKLQKVDFFDLTVKLIPSLAIKTKNLTKNYTNAVTSTHKLDSKQNEQIDKDLKENIVKLWEKLEYLVLKNFKQIYPEMYPNLLLHFVYANMISNKYRQIYAVLKQKLIENQQRFTMKQISEIIYSFARIDEQFPDLFYSYSKEIQQRYNQMAPIQLTNVYWGFSTAKLLDMQLFERIENDMFSDINKFSTEGIIQFIHSYGQMNRKYETIDFPYQEFRKILGFRILEKSFTYQQAFTLSYSLLNLNENKNFQSIWIHLIQKILQNEFEISQNPVFLHYVYLMFLHLGYIEQLNIPYLQDMEALLVKNKENLCKFYENNKKYKSSPFEKQVSKILDEHFANELLEYQGGGKVIKEFNQIQAKNWEKPIVILENNKEISKVQEFPEKKLVMPYTVDKKIGVYCFEMNGPHHYFKDQEGKYYLNGVSKLKKYFLEKIGLKYIEVPYFEFLESNFENKKDQEQYYIEQLRNIIDKNK